MCSDNITILVKATTGYLYIIVFTIILQEAGTCQYGIYYSWLLNFPQEATHSSTKVIDFMSSPGIEPRIIIIIIISLLVGIGSYNKVRDYYCPRQLLHRTRNLELAGPLRHGTLELEMEKIHGEFSQKLTVSAITYSENLVFNVNILLNE